jgi:hypothetical protein
MLARVPLDTARAQDGTDWNDWDLGTIRKKKRRATSIARREMNGRVRQAFEALSLRLIRANPRRASPSKPTVVPPLGTEALELVSASNVALASWKGSLKYILAAQGQRGCQLVSRRSSPQKSHLRRHLQDAGERSHVFAAECRRCKKARRYRKAITLWKSKATETGESDRDAWRRGRTGTKKRRALLPAACKLIARNDYFRSLRRRPPNPRRAKPSRMAVEPPSGTSLPPPSASWENGAFTERARTFRAFPYCTEL